MTIFSAVILGLVQAAGEFLPVSSSAHLAIIPWLMGEAYQGLTYDVMLHAATLFAVLFYFRKEWFEIVYNDLVKPKTEEGKMLWLLALGSVSPVIHLQQTVLGKSMYWPFTPEYNAQGYIKAEKVIEYLKKSGCKEALLHFELSHREHWDTDNKVVADHKASVQYWRHYVTD